MTRQTQQHPEVIRMQRELQAEKKENQKWRLRYARAEAAKIMQDLVGENIRFGRNEDEHQKGIKEEEKYFEGLLIEGNDEDVVKQIEVIRTRYSRGRANPAAPTQVGVARYTRTQVDVPNAQQKQDEEDENFEESLIPNIPTKDPDLRAVQQFADVQLKFRRAGDSPIEARKKAIAFMRKRAAGQ